MSPNDERIIYLVLCDSDERNAYALRSALRMEATCDRFVVVGQSAFVSDWFRSPYGFEVEVTEQYDATGGNVLIFDASAVDESGDSGHAIKKNYERFKEVVDWVRSRDSSQKTDEKRVKSQSPSSPSTESVLVDKNLKLKRKEALETGRALLLTKSKSCYVPVITKESQTQSYYFGAPFLLENEEWPEIAGKPAQFVLQLELACLPEIIRNLTGSEGFLQFFLSAGRGS